MGPAARRLNPLKNLRKKFPPPPAPESAAAVRQRRLGKIVHDDRGSASVEWQEAPENYERPVLEMEDPLAITRNSKVLGGIEVLQVETDDTFNPYERLPSERKKERENTRRDLRKLSEHIKLMRELEERKKRGDDEE